MDVDRTDLQALHMSIVKEFFSVHCLQVQNSPFRRVISSTDETLFNLDPPQTIHAIAVKEFTRVHFLHVHGTFNGSKKKFKQ